MTWEDVPGFFDFQAVYDMAVDTAEDGDTLVEVGTLFGKSAVYMAEKIKASGKNLSFYVVDKWEPWCDPIFYPNEIVDRHGSLYAAFEFYLKECGVADIVRVIRKDSADAASMFEHVHFVFIDADHSYESCLRDIKAWRPKAKIIAGHDYAPRGWPGVVRAVDESFGQVEHVGISWVVRG